MFFILDVKMVANLMYSLFFIILFTGVCGRETCSENYFYETYCEDGYYCCDDNTRCCPDTGLGVGAIIGIVVACIFFLTCCIGGIIFFVQMMTKPKRNVVPVPTQHTGLAMISQGHHAPYNQLQAQPPPYYQPTQPPAYNQPSASYGGQQSAGRDEPDKMESAVPPAATYRNQ